MKQHHVDCGHLSVLGNGGHINKQQDIVSRWAATRRRRQELFNVSFFCFSCCVFLSILWRVFLNQVYGLCATFAYSWQLYKERRLKSQACFFFFPFFFLFQSLSKCFFFFFSAVSLLVFALSVPSLLIQTGPIILSVPAETKGRGGMSRLVRKSLPHPRRSDHSHTLFQTMKLKYSPKENSKIKDEVIRAKLHFLFLILQLGGKKKSFLHYFAVSLWGNIYGLRGWVASRSVFPCLYTTVVVGETEPLQQGPRGSVLPSPALYEAVFWTEAQDQAWGTLLRSSLSRAPTLTDITSAGGRHSRPCVCAPECRCSFSACCSGAKQSGVHIHLPPWFWKREVSSAGEREKKAASHGCEHHTWNGRPGGIGQPARLELGTPDPEEVVQPWADAMQTLAGSLVQDWKMLPGMASAREEFKYSGLSYLMIPVPVPGGFSLIIRWIFLWLIASNLPLTFPASEVSQ